MDDPVVVVSGLPRSGTSLVMQMLAAGGVATLTDGHRGADEDNPRGYVELEAVKRLREDAGWIRDARGKALKVISHLLEWLPSGEDYRVVVVERNLDEVLTSQAKMATRRGETTPPQDIIRKAFEAHSVARDRLIEGRPDMTAIRLRYAEVIDQPQAAADRLQRFIGRKLNCAAMVEAVDPTLYRNRGQPG